MPATKPFVYITDLTELKARLNALDDPSTARLEIRMTGTRILPSTKVTLRVCAAHVAANAVRTADDPIDINDSRVCPPICP